MHLLIARFFNLLALLAAVAWLSRIPSWESLVTTIALFAALLAQEIWPVLSKEHKDKDLFEKFLSDFPSTGRSVRFLNEHDIGAPFKADDLNEIDSFAYSWNNSEHEFQNKKLERQRLKLLASIQMFRADLSMNVFHESRGYLTMDLKDFEDRDEKIESRDRLNRLATTVFEDHQELVRLGRKLL